MVESLLSLYKTLGSIPTHQKREKWESGGRRKDNVAVASGQATTLPVRLSLVFRGYLVVKQALFLF